MPYKDLFLVFHKSQLEQDKYLHVHMYNVEIKPDKLKHTQTHTHTFSNYYKTF